MCDKHILQLFFEDLNKPCLPWKSATTIQAQ